MRESAPGTFFPASTEPCAGLNVAHCLATSSEGEQSRTWLQRSGGDYRPSTTLPVFVALPRRDCLCLLPPQRWEVGAGLATLPSRIEPETGLVRVLLGRARDR